MVMSLTKKKSLDEIKTKIVGDGQYGNARFASEKEIRKTYIYLAYEPENWRYYGKIPEYKPKIDKGKSSKSLNKHWKYHFKKACKIADNSIMGETTKKDEFNDPKSLIFEIQKIKQEEHSDLTKTFQIERITSTGKKPLNGIILGTKKIRGKLYALVAPDDAHTLMVAAAGSGKTACFLYANIEFCMASRISFVTTDTKGDLQRKVGTIAKKYYYYDVKTIDLRNPGNSDGFNMLAVVNKYMDISQEQKSQGKPYKMFQSKSESYAKIVAKTIIGNEDTDRGANTFFYESAEGILTSAIMIISEFAEKSERHIISVAKFIQETLGRNSQYENKTDFQVILDKLPDDHKARFFAGSALNTSEEGMKSVMSTALSRLNAFIDTELEQILCFDSCIDAEEFCSKPTVLFIIMPEEDNTKYFLVSLAVEQLYRELMTFADVCGGKLPKRVMFYLDEIGTIPKISSMEMLLSAGRSRQLFVVLIIQSLAQLRKNYGDLGAEIIIDNTQNAIFSGFSPNSETAKVLSENLGQYTVQSGSISKNKEGDSESLQMMGKNLIDAFDLKTLPKFTFITMKMGFYPIKTIFPLYFDWGIKFEKPYKIDYKGDREVKYVKVESLIKNINAKHPR
jgi:type IV secretion system protein VirD4